ncbi:hypothetical protein [Liquorilactobacillus uvarum]|uniref:Uncharacterized protein n=1 Tax=Liquorilactobacillus uvarum DSM 19971 TaxID=1423812 RepID=A0A0R1PTQ1_9LACO|nr:hypothetical protein [Liquorilactobacillus uvarum]KRL33058.1 hypothetical protein FD20_GL002033 [Liquorilactobacillus uvarum DSM 19971]
METIKFTTENNEDIEIRTDGNKLTFVNLFTGEETYIVKGDKTMVVSDNYSDNAPKTLSIDANIQVDKNEEMIYIEGY